MARFILVPRKRPSSFPGLDGQPGIMSGERDDLHAQTKSLRKSDEFIEPVGELLQKTEASGFETLTAGTEAGSFLRYSVIEGDEDGADALEASYGADFIIAVDTVMEPNLPFQRAVEFDTSSMQAVPWHLDRMLVTDARTRWPQVNGQGVRVAVLDSGISPVADLHDRVVASYAYDEASGRMHPHAGGDTDYHGTFIAGLVAGYNTGIAPGASLVDFLAVPYNEVSYASRFIAAMDSILSGEPCNIVNVSAGAADPNAALESALMDLWNVGILTIAAIGNGGTSRSISPGNSRYALGIAATGVDDGLYPYNGSGHFVDQHGNFAKPDFVAPGVGLVSTDPQGGYVVDTGTSMASAVASGLAALYVSAYPDLNAQALRDLLIQSSETLGYHEDDEGYGLLTARGFWGAAMS